MQEFQTFRLAPLLALPTVPQFWLDEILWFHGERHHDVAVAPPSMFGFGAPLEVFPLYDWDDDGYDDDVDGWEDGSLPSASMQYGFGAHCYRGAPYAQTMRWCGARPATSLWLN